MPAGDLPDLIDHFPLVLEGKRLSAAVHAVDHQIVVATNRAREHEALNSGEAERDRRLRGFRVQAGHSRIGSRSGSSLSASILTS